MEAPEESGIAPLVLSDEDVRKLHDYVEAHARARRSSQRTFNEVDFLCGAMSVYFAFSLQGKIPAAWIFGPLTGRPALPEEQFTMARLAALMGAAHPTLDSLNKAVYKATNCGACVSVLDETGLWNHNGDSVDGNVRLFAVKVGCICENCDAEFEGDVLAAPVTELDFNQQLHGIEDQIEAHYDEAHSVGYDEDGEEA
jgi:hypothetical protein